MLLNEFCHDIKLNPMAMILGIIISAIGLATTFLSLILFIADYNTDRYYPDHRHLYRLESQFRLPNGERVRSAMAPLPLVTALQNEPGIDNVDYAFRLSVAVRSEGRVASGAEIYAVSPGFLRHINPYRQSLAPLAANEIYITPEFNRQYLGLSSPQGKTLDLGAHGRYVIKAVVAPRDDSSLSLPAVIAFSPWLVEGYNDKRNDWYDTHVLAFAHTAAGKTLDNRLLDRLVERYAPQLPGAPFTPGEFLHFSARDVRDMHYDGGYPDEPARVISRPLLHTLYGAALFVLLTVAVNFMSINNIVNAAKRPSLHIKRCVGASDGQIRAEYRAIMLPQFLCIAALAAVILGVGAMASGQVAAMLHPFSFWRRLAVFLLAAAMIGLIIGFCQWAYLRFFVFSARNERGDRRYETAASFYLNKLSLTLQLLACGVMVYLWAGVMVQNHYLLDADFGYERKNLLTFVVNEQLQSPATLRGLQNRLKERAGTSDFALSSWRPFDMSRTVLTVQHARQQAQDQFVSINAFSADRYFAQVWGLDTLAGAENALLESQDPSICHVIVTRAFLGLMGLSSYDEVLNTPFYIDLDGMKKSLRVLRVVDNFYLGERSRIPQPLMVFINDNPEKYGAVRYPSTRQRAQITAVLNEYGVSDGQIRSVDELHRAHYRNSLLILAIIRLVAGLSLLLMLSSAVIIGISEAGRLNRTLKIMEAVGGSVYTSVAFFLRQNMPPLLVSAAAAFVCGLWLLHRWLGQYDAVTGLTYTYALAALLLLVLAVAAVMTLSLLIGGGRYGSGRRRPEMA
ncbi:darobactin export ABC transporter permease subunit [Martelella alba]|uniref:darobactin export ABC transporter permease subunit n=1 Tax=Martelella alba TaxID=2590451 RepID=UPI0014858BB9|nr:darobactin export ABC transporter permease subunit [Martelella alba]